MLLFLYPPLWEKIWPTQKEDKEKKIKKWVVGGKAYIQMVEKETKTNKMEEESVTKKAKSHSKTPQDSENICAWLWEDCENLF